MLSSLIVNNGSYGPPIDAYVHSRFIVNYRLAPLVLDYLSEENIAFLYSKFFGKPLWKSNDVNRVTLGRSLLYLDNVRFFAHAITNLLYISLGIKTLSTKSRKVYKVSREYREYGG